MRSPEGWAIVYCSIAPLVKVDETGFSLCANDRNCLLVRRLVTTRIRGVGGGAGGTHMTVRGPMSSRLHNARKEELSTYFVFHFFLLCSLRLLFARMSIYPPSSCTSYYPFFFFLRVA